MTASRPPRAWPRLKKLISRDKVLTIMSAGGTNQTIANMRNIERYKISNIPNGLSLEFFEPLNPYIFAMGAVYDWQYKVIMDYIKYDLKMEDPKIGVVYTRKEYGKKGLNAVKNRAIVPTSGNTVLKTAKRSEIRCALIRILSWRSVSSDTRTRVPLR